MWQLLQFSALHPTSAVHARADVGIRCNPERASESGQTWGKRRRCTVVGPQLQRDVAGCPVCHAWGCPWRGSGLIGATGLAARVCF